jgi:hypothetical protein
VEHYVRRRARTPVRSLPQSGKFSGSSDVASRNRLQRFLATNATNALPPDAWNPAQRHPDALTSYPTSGACYRELPRIPILGTSVNKKRCCYSRAIAERSLHPMLHYARGLAGASIPRYILTGGTLCVTNVPLSIPCCAEISEKWPDGI